MISNKQRTIALSMMSIAAVMVFFASPLMDTHQTEAFRGGFHRAQAGAAGLWEASEAVEAGAAAAYAAAVAPADSTFLFFSKGACVT